MMERSTAWQWFAATAACLLGGVATAQAQAPLAPAQPGVSAQPGTPAQTGAPAQSGPRGVEHTARNDVPNGQLAAHPLQPAIDWATASSAQCQQLRDYAFTFVKREHLGGKLSEYEAIYMKIRRQPFSVYVYTLGPQQPKGQEAIYVQGRNDGKAFAHVTGFRHTLVGTMSLAPDSPEMMEGNRYPITNAGFDNMLANIIKRYQTDMQAGQSDVQIIPGAKVDGRLCTCVQVSHPAPQPNFMFQTTRIFYDDEHRLPIRWEAYAFPTQPGGQPQLVEEYNYRNLQLNPGLTEADFDVNNPNYGFR